MKINFILPFFTPSPGGGIKIMYEYANRLSILGHDVCIYHSLNTPYFEYPANRPFIIRKLISLVKYQNKPIPSWFKFCPNVDLRFLNHISDKYIRDADVTISTWWALVEPLSKLTINKGLKVNIVQGYEIWDGFENLVHDSYKFNNIKYICISNYLVKLIKTFNNSASVSLIYNGIDEKKFFLTDSIRERNSLSICMMYSSNNKVKGSLFGIEALKKIKEIFPSLTVDIFGIEERPESIPIWMNYYQKPNNLNEIYNRNAIFLSPSITEGWALPPAEAMTCGCLFVGTDINGHEAYLYSDHSYKVIPSSVDSIVNVLIEVLSNNALRIEKAERGFNFIKKFKWETAIRNFLEIISPVNDKF